MSTVQSALDHSLNQIHGMIAVSQRQSHTKANFEDHRVTGIHVVGMPLMVPAFFLNCSCLVTVIRPCNTGVVLEHFFDSSCVLGELLRHRDHIYLTDTDTHNILNQFSSHFLHVTLEASTHTCKLMYMHKTACSPRR